MYVRVLTAFLTLAVLPAIAQFHPAPTQGTKVVWTWGAPACDVDATKQKFTWVSDWLVSKGAPAPSVKRYQLNGPAGPSPEYAFAVFERPKYEQALHDYCLMLGSPSVTLTELESHFRFGNPFVGKVYSDPPPPAPAAPPAPSPPANPIGPPVEGLACVYFPAVGDTSPAGTVFEGKRKVVRMTPFGSQSWWECVK